MEEIPIRNQIKDSDPALKTTFIEANFIRINAFFFTSLTFKITY